MILANLQWLNLWINFTKPHRGKKKLPIFSAKKVSYKINDFDDLTFQIANICLKYYINDVCWVRHESIIIFKIYSKIVGVNLSWGVPGMGYTLCGTYSTVYIQYNNKWYHSIL